METAIHDTLAATLSELGTPNATVVQTLLLKDRFFVGWKFRYDGGHAIRLAGGNTLDFYGENGQLLKAVSLRGEQNEAA